MEIKDRVFVVTGGGSGLGAATAAMLVARGGKVLLADISAEAGRQVEAGLGERARFVPTDVSSDESARAAFEVSPRLVSASPRSTCASAIRGEPG